MRYNCSKCLADIDINLEHRLALKRVHIPDRAKSIKARNDVIKQLYEAGWSAQQIGAELGLSATLILQVLP